MLDLKLIREQPQMVKDALLKLHTEAPVDEIVSLDADRRRILLELESLRHQRNITSKKIGGLSDQREREPLITEMRGVNQKISTLEAEIRQVETSLEEAMMLVPNLPHESVPVGADDSQNVVVRQVGEPKQAADFGFEPLPHWDLGPTLDIIDFERGVKLSGSRFYLLKGVGAL